MQGVVFLVLEQVVTDLLGEDAWDEVLDRAGDDGVYIAAGQYDAARLSRLLAESPAAGPGLSPDQQLRWFGERAVPYLVARFPHSFAGHGSTAAFLRTLNDVVRDAVHRLHPAEQVPVVDVHHDPASPRWVALGHASSPGLCAVLEGLVLGLARHYGEPVQVSHPKCLRLGASSCLTLCDLEAS